MAAGIGESEHYLAVGLTEIAIKILHLGVNRFRDGITAIAEMQRRRRRNRQLRRLFGVRLEESEVLDHGMRGIAAELADDAEQNRPRLRALKFDFAFAHVGLDAREPFQKIVVP